MQNQATPALFKGLVRLEAETLDKSKQASADGRSEDLIGITNSKDGLKVLSLTGYDHAVFVLREPSHIFEAITILKSYIKDVEKYDTKTGKRRAVFDFESFARFFQLIQEKQDEVGTQVTLDQIKEIKVSEWVPEWTKLKMHSIMNSKILIYLQMKTFENLASQNLLAEADFEACLAKLNELASRANLNEDTKLVFKYLVSQETMAPTLKEAAETNYSNSVSSVTKFVSAAQSLQLAPPELLKVAQPNESQPGPVGSKNDLSIGQQAEASPTVPPKTAGNYPSTAPAFEIPASPFSPSKVVNQDTSLTQQIGDTSGRDTSRTSEQDSDSKTRSPSGRIPSTGVLDTQSPVGSKGFSAAQPAPDFAENDEENEDSMAQPASVHVTNEESKLAAERLKNTSVLIPRKHRSSQNQEYNFFLHDDAPKISSFKGAWYQALSGRDELKQRTSTVIEAVEALKIEIGKQKNPDMLQDETTVCSILAPIKEKLLPLNFIERLDVLVFAVPSICKILGTISCRSEPLLCSCGYHQGVQGIFGVFYNNLVMGTAPVGYTNLPSLSSMIKAFPTSTKTTRLLVLERLLPIVSFLQDDAANNLDAYLDGVITDEDYIKKETWFIQCQIIILSLKKNRAPQKAKSQDKLLQFLELYMKHAGKFYLAGKARADYQEEFLACCARVENLVGQKKFEDFKANIGKKQSIYLEFLDQVLTDLSPSLTSYQSLLERLALETGGSQLFRSVALNRLKQSCGELQSLSDFLSTYQKRSQKILTPAMLKPWLQKLSDALSLEAVHENLKSGPELNDSWAVLTYLEDSKLVEQEDKQDLEAYQTLLRDKFLQTVSTKDNLAALLSRLEHKQLYLQFFSEAAEASQVFQTVYDKKKLEKAFEVLQKASETEKQIQQTFQSLQKLKDLNVIQWSSTTFAPQMKAFKDFAKLGIERLNDIHEEVFSSNEKVLRSAKLMDIEFYKKIRKDKNVKPDLPLAEYQKICEEIEEQIVQLISNDKQTLVEDGFNLLSTLMNDKKSLKQISEVLKLEKHEDAVRQRFGLYKIMTQFTRINKDVNELHKLLKSVVDDSNLMEELETIHQEFQEKKSLNFGSRDLQKLLGVTAPKPKKPVKTMTSDDEDEEAEDEDQDQDVAECMKAICTDFELFFNIGNIKKLLEQFANKDSRHFQNLSFSRGISSTGLNKSQITQLEAFMVFLKKRKDKPKKAQENIKLHEFLRMVSSRFGNSKHKIYKDDFRMTEVVEKADLLIEISNNLLKGIETGAEDMNRILNKSKLVFSWTAQHNYAVFALMPNPETRDFSERDFVLEDPPLKNQTTLKALKSIKTQMAIISNTEKLAQKQKGQESDAQTDGKTDRLETFIALVDSVASINQSLDEIAALGLVYDLEGQIKKEVEAVRSTNYSSKPNKRRRARDESDDEEDEESEMENPSEPSKPDSETCDIDYSRVTECVQYSGTNIHMKLETPGSEVPEISHFLAIQKILSDLLIRSRQAMVKQGYQFHQLTRLVGQQKVLLCNYFMKFHQTSMYDSTSVKQDSERQAIIDTVDSICTFAVDKTIPPMIEDKKKNTKGTKQVEQLYMTADILERMFALNGIASEVVQSEDPTDADSSNRSLQYYLTEENRSISCLLKVLKFNQRRSPSKGTEHASRYFLAKSSTKSEELFQFLVRAAQDPSEVFYYMVDLHLLPAEVAQTLLKDLKFVFFSGSQKTCNYNLVLFMKDRSDKSMLLTELQRNNNYFKNLRLQMARVQEKELNFEDILQSLNTVVVESDLSGLGKSTYISQQAQTSDLELVTINVSGDVSPQGTMRRVAIIKERARTGKGMILHIKLDMVENFQDNSQIIDQFLFELCFLKCVQFADGYVVLNKVEKIFLEMQDTCKKAYYEKISFLLSIKTTPKCIHRIHQFKNIKDLKSTLYISK